MCDKMASTGRSQETVQFGSLIQYEQGICHVLGMNILIFACYLVIARDDFDC